MSKDKAMPKRRWATSRVAVLWLALGWCGAYSFALWSVDLVLPNIIRIVTLVVAIVTLIALYGLTYLTMSAVRRSRLFGWTGGKRAAAILVTYAVAIAWSFFPTAFVFDWDIMSAARSAPNLSFLPEGNLLLAAGRPGWSYFFVVVALVVVWRWDKIAEGIKKRKQAMLQVTLRPSRGMKVVSEDSAPASQSLQPVQPQSPSTPPNQGQPQPGYDHDDALLEQLQQMGIQ